jgi:hypothetical protein
MKGLDFRSLAAPHLANKDGGEDDDQEEDEGDEEDVEQQDDEDEDEEDLEDEEEQEEDGDEEESEEPARQMQATKPTKLESKPVQANMPAAAPRDPNSTSGSVSHHSSFYFKLIL